MPRSGQGARLEASFVSIASGVGAVTLGSSTDRGLRIIEGPVHEDDCMGGFECECGAVFNSRIRRLTLREVERLQGFPDDWTAIPWEVGGGDGHVFEGVTEVRGCGLLFPVRAHCPDGPRYEALGNSMAVPVVRWIGERVQGVETLEIARGQVR